MKSTSIRRLHPLQPLSAAPSKSKSTTANSGTFHINRDTAHQSLARFAAAHGALITIALAAICAPATGKASATDTSTDPSDYCAQLAQQFDRNLLTASPSRFLAEARGRREDGWALCTTGKASQGENILKGAIRDLGGTPEPRNPRPPL